MAACGSRPTRCCETEPVSTIPPDALQDIRLTAGLGERLTLIFVFGPAHLSREGLAEISAALGRQHDVAEHRLDRDGPDVAETIASVPLGDERPLVFVSGLDRVLPSARDELLAALNLLRDTLSAAPAIVVMWIPLELAEAFRRACVDLFQWRALSVLVDPVPQTDEHRLRHAYLRAVAAERPQLGQFERVAAERRVELASGDRELLDEWLGRVQQGLLLGPPGSGKTTALRRHAAMLASTRLDGGSGPLPVFCVARVIAWGVSSFDWRTVGLGAAAEPEFLEWLVAQLPTVPALLLVDGLDEVAPVWRGDVRDRLLALLSAQPNLRVVVSSTEIDLNSAWPNWATARLEPFGTEGDAR